MNYVLILGAGVVSMIVGSIWYGPLFGKKWMEAIGAGACTEEERKKMQKEAMPLYLVQFVLSLVQLYVLSGLLTYGGWVPQSIWVSVFLWLGFVMPTIAGGAMWNDKPTSTKWALFLIPAGFQLVLAIIFGWMFMMWL